MKDTEKKTEKELVWDECVDILENVKANSSKATFEYYLASDKKTKKAKPAKVKKVKEPKAKAVKPEQVKPTKTTKAPKPKKPKKQGGLISQWKEKLEAPYRTPYVEQKQGMVISIDKMWKHVHGEDSKEQIAILSDVSLEIGYGEIVIILGPSGSGKTTLLNLIGGYDSISLGSCVVANCPLEKCTTEQLLTYRKLNLGYVYQRYNLIELLSAYDNIAISQNLIPKEQRHLDIEELAAKLDIKEILYKFPYEMSGGQKQRVAIARAIIKEPRLLLCDEPTGALDSNSAENIIALLQAINKEYKQTILMVTHDETLTRIANRIIKISDGKIVSNELVRPLS
ncbi:ABC transporter ATP-binding protein [Mycoplasmoides pneumoniae]|uniref:ABC transporter ATP-binding protein n=1 Tax=Mycoplasmoides pneumoniae TaxID=2104 RepID=UPI000362A508|nr:ABC transporter ATP-binding protein [Mycoplasmoides pneumoniae]ALA30843.1 ABC transporter ATP-binding protein [Mycoplasmoides pneumoniae 19294]ALA37596.1 ABC transporter ATP-binding protein [Mycoplasmoides pneumoniae]ARQ38370.1 ABC transporter ATP-binding protein [Mycoplasmoides pneumoniae]ARQ40486.1 ABC transporter ATP-binding protein [Mycoplasmoides pneumoniae]PFH40819.1 ABC transporter ATP-binding protein [Mycoplasmoides pneumoniae]